MFLSRLLHAREPVAPGAALPLSILPGEGVGPEVIDACRPVLDAIEEHTAWRFDIESGGKIGTAAHAECGVSLTPEVIEFCRRGFARGAPLFCGPGGHRFVYELRREFDIYCKFVPLQPLPALADTGAMRAEAVAGVDILLLRDNAGGLYQGSWKTDREGGHVRAHHSFSYDEHQVARVMNVAVAAAGERRGRLCVVHKPWGTPAISELWVEVARRCAAGSTVELRFLEVDTAAYLMLAEAREFDVVVAPNMFGDVLADAAALLLGSRGMSYSFNCGDGGIAVYQTGHGAAYDLAGTQRANPLGQIQSLAALLRESYGLAELSRLVLQACDNALAAGIRTADIAARGTTVVTTAAMGEAVSRELSDLLRARSRAAATGA